MVVISSLTTPVNGGGEGGGGKASTYQTNWTLSEKREWLARAFNDRVVVDSSTSTGGTSSESGHQQHQKSGADLVAAASTGQQQQQEQPKPYSPWGMEPMFFEKTIQEWNLFSLTGEKEKWLQQTNLSPRFSKPLSQPAAEQRQQQEDANEDDVHHLLSTSRSAPSSPSNKKKKKNKKKAGGSVTQPIRSTRDPSGRSPVTVPSVGSMDALDEKVIQLKQQLKQQQQLFPNGGHQMMVLDGIIDPYLQRRMKDVDYELNVNHNKATKQEAARELEKILSDPNACVDSNMDPSSRPITSSSYPASPLSKSKYLGFGLGAGGLIGSGGKTSASISQRYARVTTSTTAITCPSLKEYRSDQSDQNRATNTIADRVDSVQRSNNNSVSSDPAIDSSSKVGGTTTDAPAGLHSRDLPGDDNGMEESVAVVVQEGGVEEENVYAYLTTTTTTLLTKGGADDDNDDYSDHDEQEGIEIANLSSITSSITAVVGGGHNDGTNEMGMDDTDHNGVDVDFDDFDQKEQEADQQNSSTLNVVDTTSDPVDVKVETDMAADERLPNPTEPEEEAVEKDEANVVITSETETAVDDNELPAVNSSNNLEAVEKDEANIVITSERETAVDHKEVSAVSNSNSLLAPTTSATTDDALGTAPFVGDIYEVVDSAEQLLSNKSNHGTTKNTTVAVIGKSSAFRDWNDTNNERHVKRIADIPSYYAEMNNNRSSSRSESPMLKSHSTHNKTVTRTMSPFVVTSLPTSPVNTKRKSVIIEEEFLKLNRLKNLLEDIQSAAIPSIFKSDSSCDIDNSDHLIEEYDGDRDVPEMFGSEKGEDKVIVQLMTPVSEQQLDQGNNTEHGFGIEEEEDEEIVQLLSQDSEEQIQGNNQKDDDTKVRNEVEEVVVNESEFKDLSTYHNDEVLVQVDEADVQQDLTDEIVILKENETVSEELVAVGNEEVNENREILTVQQQPGFQHDQVEEVACVESESIAINDGKKNHIVELITPIMESDVKDVTEIEEDVTCSQVPEVTTKEAEIVSDLAFQHDQIEEVVCVESESIAINDGKKNHIVELITPIMESDVKDVTEIEEDVTCSQVTEIEEDVTCSQVPEVTTKEAESVSDLAVNNTNETEDVDENAMSSTPPSDDISLPIVQSSSHLTEQEEALALDGEIQLPMVLLNESIEVEVELSADDDVVALDKKASDKGENVIIVDSCDAIVNITDFEEEEEEAIVTPDVDVVEEITKDTIQITTTAQDEHKELQEAHGIEETVEELISPTVDECFVFETTDEAQAESKEDQSSTLCIEDTQVIPKDISSDSNKNIIIEGDHVFSVENIAQFIDPISKKINTLVVSDSPTTVARKKQDAPGKISSFLYGSPVKNEVEHAHRSIKLNKSVGVSSEEGHARKQSEINKITIDLFSVPVEGVASDTLISDHQGDHQTPHGVATLCEQQPFQGNIPFSKIPFESDLYAKLSYDSASIAPFDEIEMDCGINKGTKRLQFSRKRGSFASSNGDTVNQEFFDCYEVTPDDTPLEFEIPCTANALNCKSEPLCSENVSFEKTLSVDESVGVLVGEIQVNPPEVKDCDDVENNTTSRSVNETLSVEMNFQTGDATVHEIETDIQKTEPPIVDTDAIAEMQDMTLICDNDVKEDLLSENEAIIDLKPEINVNANDCVENALETRIECGMPALESVLTSEMAIIENNNDSMTTGDVCLNDRTDESDIGIINNDDAGHDKQVQNETTLSFENSTLEMDSIQIDHESENEIETQIASIETFQTEILEHENDEGDEVVTQVERDPQSLENSTTFVEEFKAVEVTDVCVVAEACTEEIDTVHDDCNRVKAQEDGGLVNAMQMESFTVPPKKSDSLCDTCEAVGTSRVLPMESCTNDEVKSDDEGFEVDESFNTFLADGNTTSSDSVPIIDSATLIDTLNSTGNCPPQCEEEVASQICNSIMLVPESSVIDESNEVKEEPDNVSSPHEIERSMLDDSIIDEALTTDEKNKLDENSSHSLIDNLVHVTDMKINQSDSPKAESTLISSHGAEEMHEEKDKLTTDSSDAKQAAKGDSDCGTSKPELQNSRDLVKYALTTTKKLLKVKAALLSDDESDLIAALEGTPNGSLVDIPSETVNDIPSETVNDVSSERVADVPRETVNDVIDESTNEGVMLTLSEDNFEDRKLNLQSTQSIMNGFQACLHAPTVSFSPTLTFTEREEGVCNTQVESGAEKLDQDETLLVGENEESKLSVTEEVPQVLVEQSLVTKIEEEQNPEATSAIVPIKYESDKLSSDPSPSVGLYCMEACAIM